MDVLDNHPKTFDASEKENRESASNYDDGLDDLFNDIADDFQHPPQTPSPSRRSDRLLLKTPGKTPSGGQPRTPGVNKSPKAGGVLQKVKTPKQDFIMGSNRTVEEMTPFTRLIHNELMKNYPKEKEKETNMEAPTAIPEDPPAQQPDMDFPDLPDLGGDFGCMQNLDLNNFGTNFTDIFRTDVPAGTGSSPPNGYYNYLNSDYLNPNSAAGGGQDQWNGGAGGMNAETGSHINQLSPEGTSGLRRSPRKNRSG